jgi:hypothetical protein
VIGNNINAIPAESIDSILMSFLNCKVAREKIFIKFHKKIKDCVKELSVKELCKIARTYTMINSKYDFVYNTIEPFIEENVSEMELDDLCNAIIAYNNPNLK